VATTNDDDDDNNKYSTTRNRLAAGFAFVSEILLLISGYKAILTVYSLVQ